MSEGGAEKKPMGAAKLCAWLMRYAFRRWGSLLTVLAIMFVSIGVNVLKPWPVDILLVDHVLGGKPMSDDLARFVAALPGGETREGLMVWSIGGTVILFLIGWVLTVANAYVGISFGNRMVYDLAGDLFLHLQRLSLGFHSRRRLGDSIRRVTTDCACVSAIIKDALLSVLGAFFTLTAMFGIMYALNAPLTIVALGVVPLMLIGFVRYAKPMLDLSYAQNSAEGALYDVVEETLSAVPAVKAFGCEDRADERFAESVRFNMVAVLAATNVQLKFKLLVGLATAGGTAGILWLGASQAMEGGVTVGEILLFISYLGLLYGPLNSLMFTSSTVQNAAASARRVREVLDTEQEVRDAPGVVPLEKVRGHVRIERVTFGYESGQPCLRSVSAEARPGQTVAVVGQTGAGKSTLLSLIPRLHDPWDGNVFIDDRDIREVQLASLRRQVSLVLQEPFLFPISIAENIAYGRPDASMSEIEAAAKAANASQFIERLPNGYQTVVGERGATLSGGERQRLSIARALLKDAPILILDEPTSALDVETESLLLDALERLMRGRTTFIIAHRLSTIRRADLILVMDDGRVAEQGTHDELIAKGGLYARLHAIQFGESKQEEIR
jgi:ATP-binding cassette subfamily B protein